MMIEQKGIVIRVERDYAVVEVNRQPACAGDCGQKCAGCSINAKKTEIRVKNLAQAQAGDTVVLQSDGKKMLFYAFLIYIVPILAAVAGYGLGYLLGASEDGAILCAAALFVVAFAPALLANRRLSRQGGGATAVSIMEEGLGFSQE